MARSEIPCDLIAYSRATSRARGCSSGKLKRNFSPRNEARGESRCRVFGFAKSRIHAVCCCVPSCMYVSSVPKDMTARWLMRVQQQIFVFAEADFRLDVCILWKHLFSGAVFSQSVAWRVCTGLWKASRHFARSSDFQRRANLEDEIEACKTR